MGKRDDQVSPAFESTQSLANRIMQMVGVGEGIDSPDEMILGSNIELDHGRREFFFLRIFAGQVGIFSAFEGKHALQEDARNAYSEAVSSYVESMVRSFPDVTDEHVDAVFDDVNNHIDIYTQAISYEHPRGSWYQIGQTFARLCQRPNDETLVTFTAQYIKNFTDVVVRKATEAKLNAA